MFWFTMDKGGLYVLLAVLWCTLTRPEAYERETVNRYLKFVAQLSASIVLIVFLMYLFGFIGVALWGLSD